MGLKLEERQGEGRARAHTSRLAVSSDTACFLSLPSQEAKEQRFVYSAL